MQEPERSASSYRLYGAPELLRLHRIRRLQSLGLSLKQIKTILGEPEHQRSLRAILQALDQELTTRIQALEERRYSAWQPFECYGRLSGLWSLSLLSVRCLA